MNPSDTINTLNQERWIFFTPTTDMKLSIRTKLPTSWTIYNLNIFEYDQTILSNEKPNAQYGIGFACGFYSPERRNDYLYLAIGLAEAFINFESGKQGWSINNVTWLANRNRPVGENATLTFHADGNLSSEMQMVLLFGLQEHLTSLVGMKLMETGSLVLHDSKNKTVWQSFDHPTDTLLPGQKLVPGKKLVASVSETNVSEGD
ncbi:hypothetical protein GH714_004119 [Hevea brasiliensis]|uniref:Bulb-type lectin domain-containing protein n=1 Tax=Hevea brasiliensis TaxID=3981 RepID=A0A6A6LWH0_HEVBR|nr:hypothetical protein GH714_004119 [Hevea brasiliensis]